MTRGQVAALLRLPEIMQLISDLDETRWTGRPGYPIRAMVGAALVKAVYALPTWTRTARLIAEHAALREAVGGAPSHWACYRFAAKLREHGDMLTACIDRVLASLHAAHPAMGQTVAIDGSDLPAYANGHRYSVQGRPAAQEVRRPGRRMGAPLGHLHPQGRRRTTATRSMPPSAPRPACRSRGRSSTADGVRAGRWCRACWTRWPGAGSPPASPCWTRATTAEPIYEACEAGTSAR